MQSVEFNMTCPNCKMGTDRATSMQAEGTEAPKPGDWTICFYCGTWIRFTESGVREPTVEEILELPDALANAMRSITKAITSRPPIRGDDWINGGRPVR